MESRKVGLGARASYQSSLVTHVHVELYWFTLQVRTPLTQMLVAGSSDMPDRARACQPQASVPDPGLVTHDSVE